MEKAVLIDAAVGQAAREPSEVIALDDLARLLWLSEYQNPTAAKDLVGENNSRRV